MKALQDSISRVMKFIALLLLAVSLVACSDESDTHEPDQGIVGNDDAAPTAALSADESLGASENLVITFSAPMDADSLQLGGTLAVGSTVEWISVDTLQLAANTYWPPGTQTLRIDARSAEGVAMNTLATELEVRSPFTSFQRASVVIGQQDFSGGAPRQSPDAMSAQANTLDVPESSVAYAQDEDILFIADTGDSRVLGFHGVPQVNNAPADFVLGQPDFQSSTGGTTQTTMRSPQGVSAQAGHLAVGDPNSNRVLIYDDIPKTGPGEASAVVGQPDFESRGDTCAPASLNHVHGHFVTPSGQLLVADGVNSRVMIWNELPGENGSVPDLVLGQSRLDQCAANDDNQDGVQDAIASARTLQHPSSVWSDGERIVVVDNYNNRVLIWNAFPQENFAPADIVLGQSNMQTNAANDDDQNGEPDVTPSACVLNYPWTAWVEREQVFVADEGNNRVLIWNEWPEQSFVPADVVIGQQDFNTAAINAGNAQPDANTLHAPKGVRVIDDQLLVTDTGNSRVLVFDAQ